MGEEGNVALLFSRDIRECRSHVSVRLKVGITDSERKGGEKCLFGD